MCCNTETKIDEQIIKGSIKECEFGKLKELENKVGFNEAPIKKESKERII